MPASLRFRVPPGLEHFFSILGTGLHLVQLTGQLPTPAEPARLRVRVMVSDDDLARIDQIATMHGISRNAAVVAALQWATRANVLPDRAAIRGVSGESLETLSEEPCRRRSA